MEEGTPGKILLAVLASFLILMIMIPLIYHSGAFIGLDGRPGVLDSGWKVAFADPISKFFYGLGDMFCHQEQDRSFILNGSQLAFCQRDMSILFGVILGLALFLHRRITIFAQDKRALLIGVLLLAITLIEWAIESYFSLDVIGMRVTSGVISGIGIAVIFQCLVARQYKAAMAVP
jgi:Predicted membrane protein